MMTVVPASLEKAKTETLSLLQDRVARSDECPLSTHNLRNILVRRLDVGGNTAKLLVMHIVKHLTRRGILERWDSVGRGTIYRVNVEKLRELTDEDMVR